MSVAETESEGQPTAPRVHDVRLTRSPPFVEVVEREESRREHAMMAVLMSVMTAIGAGSPELPAVFSATTAFVAGYAVRSWLVHDNLYAGGGD